MPSFMRRPGRAAGSADCLDESPGTGAPALRGGLPAGGGAGVVVWLPAAPAPKAHHPERPAFPPWPGLGLAVSGFPSLRRGPKGRLLRGPGGGLAGLHYDGWPVAGSHIFLFLEGCGMERRAFDLPCKKIFAIFENFICIWTKMGYNRVEQLSNASTAGRRCSL